MTDLADCRVLYVATGERYVLEALQSIRSLWSYNPEIRITMYIDQQSRQSLKAALSSPALVSELIEIVDHPRPTYSMSDKCVALLHEAVAPRQPWERALYLDGDTWICGDISPVFELLARFDVAAAHAPIRLDPRQPRTVTGQAPVSFPELNAGVIAYRRSTLMIDFLKRWVTLDTEITESIQGAFPTDQAAFRLALYHSDVRLAVLSSEYNCRIPYPTYVYGPVRIIHGRWPDLKEIEERLNASTSPRVFLPGIGVLSTASRTLRIVRKYRSWREQGTIAILRNRLAEIRRK